MTRRKRSFDEAKIARFTAEGRGIGRGADYKPWLTIYDVPSTGREHRVFGRKISRIHHLLSDIEWRLFLHLEWSDVVIDIREQFSLDRDVTRRIAETLGVLHPQDVVSKTQLVMTTDFVVDLVRDGRVVTEARAVKPAAGLDKLRTLEKLQIERLYWSQRDINWRLVTERDFSPVLVRNLEWIRGPAHEHQEEPWEGYSSEKAAMILCEVPASPHLTLRRFCDRMDQGLAMEPGSSLMLVRHLLATKALRTDMTNQLTDKMAMDRFRLPAGNVGARSVRR
jgi:TnsA endonuclease N terminal/TnsA endonuclease C terminal